MEKEASFQYFRRYHGWISLTTYSAVFLRIEGKIAVRRQVDEESCRKRTKAIEVIFGTCHSTRNIICDF